MSGALGPNALDKHSANLNDNSQRSGWLIAKHSFSASLGGCGGPPFSISFIDGRFRASGMIFPFLTFKRNIMRNQPNGHRITKINLRCPFVHACKPKDTWNSDLVGFYDSSHFERLHRWLFLGLCIHSRLSSSLRVALPIFFNEIQF